jgi:SAM-dependent methyltransferase
MAREQEADGGGKELTWNDYYKWLEGREPRPLFLEAFERFEQASTAGRQLQAIDLGFGDGTETVALLAAGWRVLAIDNEPEAIARLEAATPAEYRPRLETLAVSFQEVELPKADLVHAGYSLAFCHPEHFGRLWADIRTCLLPGGRFAGQLFGIRDDWANNPDQTFLSAEQVNELLEDGFETETLREIDEDGQALSGPKHWHIFEIVARRAER